MNFTNNKGASMEQMFEDVKAKFPQYQITLKRNKFLRFDYIQVKKSALIGSWIRIKKNKVTLIGCIPSVFVRMMFGSVLLITFISGSLRNLRQEVGGYLQAHYS